MARPKKATVDYFPHFTKHGKTLFILESRWGNDGYAAWFKILECIGQSDGLYIDCRDQYSWQHLIAVTRVTEEVLKEVIDILTILGAIDRELWHHGIIYCQKFVDGVTDAYRKRINTLPSREKVISAAMVQLTGFPPPETPKLGVSPAGSTESKEEREKEREEDIADKSAPPSSLFHLWNRVVESPKVLAMNKGREAKCRIRLKERSLEEWEKVFSCINSTPFLCGDNDRGWRADFDWIIANDTNVMKVIEGKYQKPSSGNNKPIVSDEAYIEELRAKGLPV